MIAVLHLSWISLRTPCYSQVDVSTCELLGMICVVSCEGPIRGCGASWIWRLCTQRLPNTTYTPSPKSLHRPRHCFLRSHRTAHWRAGVREYYRAPLYPTSQTPPLQRHAQFPFDRGKNPTRQVLAFHSSLGSDLACDTCHGVLL